MSGISRGTSKAKNDSEVRVCGRRLLKEIQHSISGELLSARHAMRLAECRAQRASCELSCTEHRLQRDEERLARSSALARSEIAKLQSKCCQLRGVVSQRTEEVGKARGQLQHASSVKQAMLRCENFLDVALAQELVSLRAEKSALQAENRELRLRIAKSDRSQSNDVLAPAKPQKTTSCAADAAKDSSTFMEQYHRPRPAALDAASLATTADSTPQGTPAWMQIHEKVSKTTPRETLSWALMHQTQPQSQLSDPKRPVSKTGSNSFYWPM
eukprot:TRINITY_DN58108_c0_g1_i1.p1 TRINITY_DN58108_c0_g1~~TRINITY_DN58108_c0_g1_i1.p1  ORF type:complete len:271 (-),score=36.55 TRINITY_DN58108_c0_g1_i1:350-1162(-)